MNYLIKRFIELAPPFMIAYIMGMEYISKINAIGYGLLWLIMWTVVYGIVIGDDEAWIGCGKELEGK